MEALSTAKINVDNVMPKAAVRTTTTVKVGFFHMPRVATRTSLRRELAKSPQPEGVGLA
jgi:hypothetical protein